MKTMLFAFIVAGLLTPSFAATVSDVSVRQQWPWSRKVAIRYSLETDVPVDLDVRVTSGGKTTTVSATSLSGAWAAVSSGVGQTLYWDPSLTFPNEEVLLSAQIEVVPVTERKYMIVDLADGLSDGLARISYTNVVIGTKTASNDEAEWKLWDDYYKTNAIVLRRCLPGTFMMGSRPGERNRPSDFSHENYHQVTLTRAFYIGVFEVTQTQYKKLTGNTSGYFTTRPEMRPQTDVNWSTWRGGGSTDYANWPNADLSVAHKVSASSFFGVLRAKAGGTLLFDFPTSAQWEYACRAGTTTSYYNGKDMSGPWNATTDAALDPLARYGGNSSIGWGGAATTDPDAGGTAIVGSYEPNAWGLFDMLANVAECCLDNYDVTGTEPETDPVGPARNSNGTRVSRGARWCDNPGNGAARPAAAGVGFVYTSGMDIGKAGGARVSVTIY